MHSARSHMARARKRKNVTVLTHAMVDRIAFEGKHATSVRFRHNGRWQEVRAAREILLSAGAIASPLILQRSGVGPGALIEAHGITPVLDNAHVGGGLQDHLGVDYFFRATEPTLNSALRPLFG